MYVQGEKMSRTLSLYMKASRLPPASVSARDPRQIASACRSTTTQDAGRGGSPASIDDAIR